VINLGASGGESASARPLKARSKSELIKYILVMPVSIYVLLEKATQPGNQFFSKR
jgi:hypothetical protein